MEEVSNIGAGKTISIGSHSEIGIQCRYQPRHARRVKADQTKNHRTSSIKIPMIGQRTISVPAVLAGKRAA
jgi:hypothetical protein